MSLSASASAVALDVVAPRATALRATASEIAEDAPSTGDETPLAPADEPSRLPACRGGGFACLDQLECSGDVAATTAKRRRIISGYGAEDADRADGVDEAFASPSSMRLVNGADARDAQPPAIVRQRKVALRGGVPGKRLDLRGGSFDTEDVQRESDCNGTFEAEFEAELSAAMGRRPLPGEMWQLVFGGSFSLEDVQRESDSDVEAELAAAVQRRPPRDEMRQLAAVSDLSATALPFVSGAAAHVVLPRGHHGHGARLPALRGGGAGLDAVDNAAEPLTAAGALKRKNALVCAQSGGAKPRTRRHEATRDALQVLSPNEGDGSVSHRLADKQFTARLTALRWDHKRALALLDERRASGIPCDVFHYNATISACGKGGQWQRALALLVKMRAAGVSPNVITFNATISACGKGGQWQRALALLDEMRAAGVSPGVITFSAAILACARGNELQKDE